MDIAEKNVNTLFFGESNLPPPPPTHTPPIHIHPYTNTTLNMRAQSCIHMIILSMSYMHLHGPQWTLSSTHTHTQPKGTWLHILKWFIKMCIIQKQYINQSSFGVLGRTDQIMAKRVCVAQMYMSIMLTQSSPWKMLLRWSSIFCHLCSSQILTPLGLSVGGKREVEGGS